MPTFNRLDAGLPMRFEFATAGRIIYGPGTIREVPVIASGWGTCACIVTGKNPARATAVIDHLNSRGVSCMTYPVQNEPTMEIVTEGVQLARRAGANIVVAIGGGSAIDAGKAIAALLANPGELLEYLEVVGQGKEILIPPVPMIAIPTTAGTGAEVTRNAVIASAQRHVKVSMRSHLMLPRLAVIDPELTYSLPWNITASTGLDALTQLMEAFVTQRANPFTDGLCREGMQRVARSLQAACKSGHPQARANMCIAALFSGLALANAGLGAAH
jgi:alcohol dehydrogenase class IV